MTDEPDEAKGTYQLRFTWRTHAINKGIKPNVHALAIAANVSPSTLYRIEKGETAPNAWTIRALVQTLGVPFDSLFEPLDPDEGG